jgi:hypothetical protein
LPYTPGILEYLEQSRKRKKIYQLYAAVETKLQRAVSVLPVTEWETRRSYPVQDYERFPDLATFFQEVVWMVKFSSHKGAYKAGMYNTAQLEEFGHAPLFLLDNKATFDADFIARLKPADIDTIDLLYEPKLLRKHFPAIGSGGVIRIKTLRRNGVLPSEQEANIFPLHGFMPEAPFPGIEADASGPELRPVLYWSPALRTDAQGKATIMFNHPDDRGDFIVEIVVQGPDGERGIDWFRYSVK